MSVKFTHLRVQQNPTPADAMKGQPLSIAPLGGATLCWNDDPDKVDHVQVSVARCAPHDNFCKKIGRDIALGRLTDGNFFTVPVPDRKDLRGTAGDLADWYYDEYLPMVTPMHLIPDAGEDQNA